MTTRQLFSFVIILTTLLSTACGGGEDIPTNGDNNTGTEEPENPVKPQPESPFTIKVLDITATAARVTVAAKSSKEQFYFDILREEYFNNYNDRLGFQAFINNTVQGLMTSNNMTKEEVLSRILSSGNDSYGFTGLEAGSVYYAVAMGVSDTGLLTTDVAIVKFTTLSVEQSANIFDMSVGSATYTGTTYTVKPSISTEQYVLRAWNKKVVDQMNDTEFIKHCLKMRSDIDEYVVTGEQKGVIDSCVPGRDYYLVAFGYQGGVATTGVTKVPFTTKSGGNPNECKFTFEVSDIQYDRAYMKVTPSAKHTPFFWSVVEKNYYNQLSANVGEVNAMKSVLAESIAPFAHDFGNIHDALEIITSYDDVSVEGTTYGLVQGTEYIPWAVCIDNDGNAAASFVMGESFTTKSDNIAECKIGVKGSWETGSDGKAVLISTATPDSNCAGFYNVIFLGDLTGTSRQTLLNNITREQMFHNLNPCVFDKCSWGQTVTAAAVGYDKDGNYGEIAIDVFTPVKE